MEEGRERITLERIARALGKTEEQIARLKEQAAELNFLGGAFRRYADRARHNPPLQFSAAAHLDCAKGAGQVFVRRNNAQLPGGSWMRRGLARQSKGGLPRLVLSV